MFVITFKLTIVSIMSSFSVVGIVFPCGLIVIYMIVNIINIIYRFVLYTQ